MAILLPFNIILSCMDFYEEKVSLTGLNFSLWRFLILILSLDAWLVSSADLSVRFAVSSILRVYVLHNLWGPLDESWDSDRPLFRVLGSWPEHHTFSCERRRRIWILERICYAGNPRLVLRYISRMRLQGECKTSRWLHRHLSDELRSGWNSKQCPQVRHSWDLARLASRFSKCKLFSWSAC